MKKLVLGVIILILMGFAAKELITSKKVTSQPEASGYKYYYYPTLNMYYDATQNNFVYTVDGGVSWQTKKPSNADLPEKLSRKVTFYSPDPDAWVYNSQHRQQYNGVITNFVQRMEDTAQFVPAPAPVKQDSVRSVPQEDVKESQTQEERKKGSSWFNRLKEKIKKGLKKNKEPESDSL
ncbi:MAG TPA: hypothetical protein VD794_15050 [Flavisolibacter sp.]|nr:hypothetical protein [Flavisolibacter sp.]